MISLAGQDGGEEFGALEWQDPETDREAARCVDGSEFAVQAAGIPIRRWKLGRLLQIAVAPRGDERLELRAIFFQRPSQAVDESAARAAVVLLRQVEQTVTELDLVVRAVKVLEEAIANPGLNVVGGPTSKARSLYEASPWRLASASISITEVFELLSSGVNHRATLGSSNRSLPCALAMSLIALRTALALAEAFAPGTVWVSSRRARVLL